MLTARELAAAHWNLIQSARYSTLRLLHGAMVLVYGPPAAGKSTMALGFVDGLEGAAVVYLAEEALAPAVGERLVRLGIRDSRIQLVARASLDQLAAIIRAAKARSLLIDSVAATTLSAGDLRHLLVVAKLHCLVAVQQVTKQGAPAGRNTLLHEADVAVDVDNGTWRLTKSRYQPVGLAGRVDHGKGRDEQQD